MVSFVTFGCPLTFARVFLVAHSRFGHRTDCLYVVFYMLTRERADKDVSHVTMNNLETSFSL